MINQMLDTLQRVVQSREGQLVIASHSERVWDWFSREEEKIELTPFASPKRLACPRGAF
jgi:ligand-binding SRPBCC domain-containing protein